MSAAAGTVLSSDKALSRRQAIGLTFFCTLLAAVSQILIKIGANHLPEAGLQHTVVAAATSVPLIVGYALYGLMTLVFIFALRDEELSTLFPIISLTYVWVAWLSFYFFHEAMNAAKWFGITVIVIGVAVLGKGGRK